VKKHQQLLDLDFFLVKRGVGTNTNGARSMNPKPNEKAHNLSAPLNQIAEADNGRVFSFSPFPLYHSLSRSHSHHSLRLRSKTFTRSTIQNPNSGIVIIIVITRRCWHVLVVPSMASPRCNAIPNHLTFSSPILSSSLPPLASPLPANATSARFFLAGVAVAPRSEHPRTRRRCRSPSSATVAYCSRIP